MKAGRGIGLVFALFLAGSFSLSGQVNEKRLLRETSHRTWYAVYDSSGEFIASAGTDNNIIVWNAGSGIVHRTLAGLRKRTRQMAFSVDGTTLWSAGDGGMITAWDIRLAKISSNSPGHSGAVNSLAVNRQGTRLVSAGEDKIVRIWAIGQEGLDLILELKGHKKGITGVDFSPDGTLVASVGGDRRLMVWDVQTGALLRETEAHDGWIRCVSFSPDGKQISTGGDDRLIRTWDVSDLSMLKQFEGHEGWVQSIAYSPSGKLLISGGHDQYIRLWDAGGGDQLAVSDKLDQVVLSVDASPAGTDFVSSCLYSEKIRIWAQDFDHAGSVIAQRESETGGSNGPAIAAAPGAPAPGTQPVITIFSPMATGGSLEHDRSSILVVGKAEAGEGIQTVVVNRQRAELNDAGVFQAEVILAKGENVIEVTAVSRKGKMGSTSLRINCTSETAVRTVEEEAGLSGGRYFALIIGVNEYTDGEIDDLDYPLADADSIHEVLVRHYNFKREDITFLKNPTREEMIIALDELGQRVTNEDNLLIFYAGHGFWDEKTGIGYWLPSNAARSNTANWFRNSTLRDFIGSINSKHTLLIADACFSGSIFKTRSGFSSDEQGVMKLHELPSRKAMTSGALKEVPDRSVFVKYLVRALKQNTDAYLPSEALFGSFKAAVLNNSPNVPQYGTIQNVGDEGGDFVFRRD